MVKVINQEVESLRLHRAVNSSNNLGTILIRIGDRMTAEVQQVEEGLEGVLLPEQALRVTKGAVGVGTAGVIEVGPEGQFISYSLCRNMC